MKAAMYSVHRFERKGFDNANRDRMHEIDYIAAPLDATTVPLAEGCKVVIPPRRCGCGYAAMLAERGVTLIALRARATTTWTLPLPPGWVSSPFTCPPTHRMVAELVFALTLALIRRVPGAYQRPRDEGLQR